MGSAVGQLALGLVIYCGYVLVAVALIWGVLRIVRFITEEDDDGR